MMSLARILTLLTFCAPFSTAEDIGLIRVSQPWKYFKATHEPLPSWKTAGFDDSAWPEAKSGFSNVSVFSEQTTFADYGLGYTSIYFRRRFNVADPVAIKELILRLDFDDGFVAYLNGREVARRGVEGPPDSPVTFRDLAAWHLRGLTEEINVSNGIADLLPGTNLLAVQILGSSTNESSMAFAPELLANFTRSPYIQNTTTHSTQVAWKTFSPAAGLIEFGLTETNSTVLDLPAGTNHVATLEELSADTRYSYRVGARFETATAWSDWSWFRTFKTEGTATFAMFADTGWGTPQQYQVAEQLRGTPVDFIMHAGDLAYGAITERNSDLRVLSPQAEQLRTTPMYLAIGNHDALVDIRVALNLFHLPTNNATGTEHYYSFDHGDAHFVALWSDLAAGARYHPGSAQYQWLHEDLAKTTKPWKFIFFHHCWRTSAMHRIDDYDLNGVLDMNQLDALAELAGRHGVQIIFHGHDHCFERFTPKHGIVSYIGGGGGAALYGLNTPHPDSIYFIPRHHFLKVNVSRDVTTVQAIDELGRLMDSTHVTRDFPADKIYQAAWHSPGIEARAADDGDGNIQGQLFDFAGEAIPARIGRGTSAGRLFVNNNSEHLFLGLDEVLLHAGEELFVFVESATSAAAEPRTFGWQLQFTNFHPGFVLIGGDEYADIFGGMPHPRQGLRHLQQGLPIVAGQTLQQFSRSPQNSIALHEQSASCLELAIPLDELGLIPGAIIRVAAVVAHVPSAEGTTFDSGGIRASNENSVEPLTIRLASEPPLDADLDGAPDLSEWIAGTDPASGSSVLKISATRKPNGFIELSWSAVPGRWYRLEYLDQPGSAFREFSHAEFPRKAVSSVERTTVPAGQARRFEYYRVVLVSE